MQDLRSVFEDDCNVLDLDENELKIEEVDETPLKENNVIIPRIRKRAKKSTLVIEPLSEMTAAEENETDFSCPACGKVLKNKGNLNTSSCTKIVRSHSGQDFHPCKYLEEVSIC